MNKLAKAVLLPTVGLTFGLISFIQILVTQFFVLGFVLSSIILAVSLIYLVV